MNLANRYRNASEWYNSTHSPLSTAMDHFHYAQCIDAKAILIINDEQRGIGIEFHDGSIWRKSVEVLP